MTRQKLRRVVRVRVPDRQSPFVIIDGAPCVSLLWSFGGDVEVPLDDLANLIAGTRGSIVLARKLVGAERRTFEEYRRLDAECHARIIRSESVRFERARKGR